MLENLVPCPLDSMGHWVLHPSLSAGIRVQNKKSGHVSGPHSFSLSWTMSLWSAVLWVCAILLAIRAMLLFCRFRLFCKLQKKSRRRMKKKKK